MKWKQALRSLFHFFNSLPAIELLKKVNSCFIHRDKNLYNRFTIPKKTAS